MTCFNVWELLIFPIRLFYKFVTTYQHNIKQIGKKNQPIAQNVRMCKNHQMTTTRSPQQSPNVVC